MAQPYIRRAVAWLSVKPWRVLLRPGRSRTIRYQVQVPEEASGELRAQVFFTTYEAQSQIAPTPRSLAAAAWSTPR